jgi:hypothetical protein
MMHRLFRKGQEEGAEMEMDGHWSREDHLDSNLGQLQICPSVEWKRIATQKRPSYVFSFYSVIRT